MKFPEAKPQLDPKVSIKRRYQRLRRLRDLLQLLGTTPEKFKNLQVSVGICNQLARVYTSGDGDKVLITVGVEFYVLTGHKIYYMAKFWEGYDSSLTSVYPICGECEKHNYGLPWQNSQTERRKNFARYLANFLTHLLTSETTVKLYNSYADCLTTMHQQWALSHELKDTYVAGRLPEIFNLRLRLLELYNGVNLDKSAGICFQTVSDGSVFGEFSSLFCHIREVFKLWSKCHVATYPIGGGKEFVTGVKRWEGKSLKLRRELLLFLINFIDTFCWAATRIYPNTTSYHWYYTVLTCTKEHLKETQANSNKEQQ